MNINLPVPPKGSIRFLYDLVAKLKTIFIELDVKTKKHTAITAPTTGKWARGNIVWNLETEELGVTKYVIIGWSCIASGEPGTWVELRCRTGN